MRKLFTLLFALAATISLFAAGTKIGDLYYNINTSNRTAEVTYELNNNAANYAELDTIVTIPSSVEYDGVTYRVNQIGKYAFYKSGIRWCTMPKSVTVIGEAAFASTQLRKAEIGDGVKTVNKSAFADCPLMTSAYIGEKVTDITKSTIFYNCPALTFIEWNAERHPDFSDGVPNCFYNVRGQITHFKIGRAVRYIPSYLCMDLFKLEVVYVFSHYLEGFGKNIFERCDADGTGINEVIWDVIVPQVDDTPFGYIVKESDEIIGEHNVYHAYPIQKITFGPNTKHIPAFLCEDMKYLETITLPSCVESIGNWAFSGCEKLTSFTCLAIAPPAIKYIVDEVWDESEEFYFYPYCLYVPAGSVDAYKADDYWNEQFNPILPIEGTAEGIEEVMANPATNGRKVLIDGQVLIVNDNKAFTLQGQEVK